MELKIVLSNRLAIRENGIVKDALTLNDFMRCNQSKEDNI